jgi:hypothetical protein
MGEAGALKNEFAKVGETKEAREWKLTQIMLLSGPLFGSLFMLPWVVFKLGVFSDITPAEQASGLAAVGAMVLFGCGGLLAYRLFPVIPNKKVRGAICVSGGVLASVWIMLFCHLILLHADFTLSQMLVAVLWGFLMPWGIVCGLVGGLEKAAWEGTRRIA